jgi:hypothetical protein
MKKFFLSLALILVSMSSVAQEVMKGDANGDKKVDRDDVTEVANAALNQPSGNFVFQNADVNEDSKINAADIVLILNMIIEKYAVHYQSIVLTKKDGSVEKFDFTDNPVVTYSGNDLVITTSKTKAQFPVYLLDKLSFSDGWIE